MFRKGVTSAVSALILLAASSTAAPIAFPVSVPALSVPGCTINATFLQSDASWCLGAGSSCPAVLLLAGSGPTDRDGNSPLLPSAKIDTLKDIAEELSSYGYHSMRFDKLAASVARDPSSCPALLTADLTIESESADVIPLVQILRENPVVSKVVLAGHSEGSFQAMLMLDKVSADGFVSLEGTASNIHDVLQAQLRPQLQHYPEVWQQCQYILDELLNGRTVPVDQIPAQLKSLFGSLMIQKYIISWMKYTPAKLFASQNIPSAITQGTTDIQVFLSEGRALHAARPDAMYFELEFMSHTLKFANSTSAADQYPSYHDPLPLHKDLIPSILKFLAQF